GGPSVDVHLVAGLRVGVGGDIGHPTTGGDGGTPLWHTDLRLPVGKAEGVAHAATGGAALATVVPDGLGGHGGAVGVEGRAAAAEDVRAGGREVGVDARLVVAASVVTRGGGDGHPEGDRIGDRVVHRGACLGGPLVLAGSPADADRRRSGLRVGRGGDR